MSKPSIIRPLANDLLACGINFMLYGDPGVGKTPMLGTGAKTLILDADNGTDSAAISGSTAERWPINGWVDMDEAYEYIRHEGVRDYKWVWLDGISIGQEKLLEDTMLDLINVRKKAHRKPYLADMGEYGENMTRIKQWVSHMSALPINFGITAHPFRYADPITDEEYLMPWVQGRNMAPTICGHMNLIGFLVMGEDGKQRLYVKKTERHYGKDRFRALGSGLLGPTIPRIEQLIKVKVEEGRRLAQQQRAASTAPKATAATVKKSAQRAATARSK